MNKDEALKIAIEALEDANSMIASEWSRYGEYDEAINACKEALDLSEKQYTFPDKLKIANCDLKQPAQEASEQAPCEQPVAWQWLKSGHMRKKIPKTATPEHWRPLYTHPHQWQGLTDDELNELHHKWIMNSGNKDTQYDFARAIEQALKEKNHG